MGRNDKPMFQFLKDKEIFHDRSKEKTDLSFFRNEIRKILKIINSFSHIVEKASIDEVFVDLT